VSEPITIAGVMSGTSADGIDVALIRFASSPGSRQITISNTNIRRQVRPQPTLAAGQPTIELIGHAGYSYPAKIRAAILAAMNAPAASVADLSRLNFVLGELYADAVLNTQKRFRTKADLIGCHGQTLYHQGEPLPFAGKRVAATWQSGEAAVIAARLGIPVVSDFRPADLAAGGKGAPLVPYLDYLLFRDQKTGRIVQNIGGIANLTAIPAKGGVQDVFAFDTGPGNMVIDAVMEARFGQSFDRGGKIAASGKTIEPVLNRMLKHSFFRATPPKTAGREEFGREFAQEFLRQCRDAPKQDAVATATALTACSIAGAVRRFVISKSRNNRAYGEMIVSGGGAKNTTLMSMLAGQLVPLGIVARFSDEFGLPAEAKEAVAFAVLAYETWNRRPSNVPSATGAKRPAILGKISYV
jgi:anhydro-N-acetylmuramic acid kinase